MDKEYLIQKWLADDLSPEEREAFEAMQEAGFLEGIAADAAAFKAPEFSIEANYQDLKEQIQSSENQLKKLHWSNPFLRIASVLVVGLGLYFAFIYENLTEIRSDYGQKIVITLPDDSEVTVNALSEIAYNENKWDKNREINLEGEAYFDVAKGARFDVVTSQGSVTVLGTEFNVKQRGTFFEVHCYEGKVQVTAEAHDSVLFEGDYFRLMDGVVSTGKNTSAEPRWTNNVSDFDRVPLSEVFAELERQYEIEIILEEVHSDQLFTGVFGHDNLEMALVAITEPLDLEYASVQEGKVRIRVREK